jgi:hypothetical protein
MNDTPRKMGPLAADHWLVTDRKGCSACGELFQAGEHCTLVALGPGSDPEARARAAAGRAYNAVAVPVHWECAVRAENISPER